MKIFQIGAAGGIGTRLSELLVARGDDVTGMHRKASQAEGIAATGARPVTGDLIADDVDALAAKFNGHDTVVFSAGAHGTGREQTTLIDGEGLKKSAAAAAQAGARRFVLVSAFPESERDGGLGEGFEHYMRINLFACDCAGLTSPTACLTVEPRISPSQAGDGSPSGGVRWGARRARSARSARPHCEAPGLAARSAALIP